MAVMCDEQRRQPRTWYCSNMSWYGCFSASLILSQRDLAARLACDGAITGTLSQLASTHENGAGRA